ncbi:MAG: alpha/beta hydrolase [Kiritimatiellia bacterium]
MNTAPSVNLPEIVSLWPSGEVPFSGPEDGELPRLTVYLPSEEYRTGQSVLILPGGGYGGLSSAKEGHRPAQYLNAHGIAAAVLEYRHAPQRHPVPLVDAQRGLRRLRAFADEHGLSTEHVGVMGFSAGGHLAGTLSTQLSVEAGLAGDTFDKCSCRPDFAVLIYPVVSLSAPWSHFGSRDNLLGVPADPELAERLSIEKAVTPDTPRMFLVHAQNDGGVPVANSLVLTQALRDHGVPADLHVYSEGGHGFGMAANHEWGPALLTWLAR